MDCRQEEIVNSLLDSYCEVGGINHLDSSNLPSKRVVGAICDDLLQLLFPGFFSEEVVSSEELPLITNERIASIRERLGAELRRSVRLKNPESKDHRAEANELCCGFLRRIPEVRRLLQTDVEAAYEGDPAARSFEEIIVAYPFLEAIAIQRLAHLLYRDGVPLIPRMMTEWAHSRTGIDIHPGAQIGSHFFIDHGTGVVIGETTVIGERVRLYQGVTLGALSLPTGAARRQQGHKRHPTIEDEVIIYANATILGGSTVIGRGAVIGGNSFVTESIPPNTRVINPCR